MKVIDAYPPNSPGARPLCEATLGVWATESHSLREKHGRSTSRRARLKIAPDHCDNHARYNVNGQWLCRKHAAYLLLDRIATEGKVE